MLLKEKKTQAIRSRFMQVWMVRVEDFLANFRSSSFLVFSVFAGPVRETLRNECKRIVERAPVEEIFTFLEVNIPSKPVRQER